MEKILVFGAGGFIGTYLVDRLLESGYEVVASDNNDICSEYYDSIGVDYVKLDITSQEEFSKVSNRQYSAVVNLAAMQPANVSEKNYSSVDYIRMELSVLFLRLLIEVLKVYGIKKSQFEKKMGDL